MTDRDVMEAVARVDCWLRDALRLLPVVAVLGAVLLLAVMAALAWVRYDPHRIDYDAPGGGHHVRGAGRRLDRGVVQNEEWW